MRGMTRDTIAELLDRKMIWVFLILTVLVMLVASASRSIDIQMQASGADAEMIKLQFGDIAMKFVDGFAAFLLFLAVMTSAGTIPQMLERGRADYYFSKPVSRSFLLLSKLQSVWMIYGAIVLASSLLVYGSLAMAHQLFDAKVLLLVSIVLLELFVWLTVTFAAGVLSGSTATAIATAFMLWIFQLILSGREAIKMFFSNKAASMAVDTAYYILPKTSEMSKIGVALGTGQTVDTWVPVWSSLLFAVLLVFLTLFYLSRKDY